MRDEEYRLLWEEEERHWWHAGKRQIVRGQVLKFLAGRSTNQGKVRLLDVGCGDGALLRELGCLVEAEGIDCHLPLVERARAGGLRVCHGDACRLPYDNATFFDLVLLLDVLEHLDDDRLGLMEAGRVLRPGGMVLVSVPAHPWLYGSHDRALGHRRRYTPQSLFRTAGGAGLSVEFMSYTNFFIFPAAALVRMKERSQSGGAVRGCLPPFWGKFIAGFYRVESWWLKRWSIPIGLSLLVRLSKEAFL
ncbi:class I SAM-dependent methyltransferase [Desulfofundulus thermosubterraneus]|uniref:Methyltransferase domain-containing protein n=1 Tax=Desulfofundulus thermosubterraneus DSM 16057 TaxID=1121432 RepID=A0A1M6D727_9FIRM|nr:class I SAM-dependent methyltransferase [Desulfofundulus thermosubterraneus]SHI69027.1 Methyltransferase domain-containing protein [Desulfofundulus thermosubterraneus DSM 16057]